MQYKGIFASSSDESGQTLSTTVNGAVVVLSAVVPLLAMKFFHLTITADDVSSLVYEGGIFTGSIWAIRGLVMKIINRVGTVPSTNSVG